MAYSKLLTCTLTALVEHRPTWGRALHVACSKADKPARLVHARSPDLPV